MNHPYYQEFLGSMKQFEPITSDQVKKESKGVFGLDELSIFLLERGLSSEKVVYDPTRLYLNTFYADYENGLYIPMLALAEDLLVPCCGPQDIRKRF